MIYPVADRLAMSQTIMDQTGCDQGTADMTLHHLITQFEVAQTKAAAAQGTEPLDAIQQDFDRIRYQSRYTSSDTPTDWSIAVMKEMLKLVLRLLFHIARRK